MIIGSKEDAFKFGVQINIPCRTTSLTMELNFKGKIHSILMDKHQVYIDDEEVLDFARSMANNILDQVPDDGRLGIRAQFAVYKRDEDGALTLPATLNASLKSARWTCNECTYKNEEIRAICGMCSNVQNLEPSADDYDDDDDEEDEEEEEEEEVVDESRPEATFRFPIPNLSKFKKGDYISKVSPSFMVRNLPWKIKIRRWADGNMGYGLSCNKGSKGTTWSCQAQFELRVLSQVPGKGHVSMKDSHLFSNKSNGSGWLCYMKWADVLNPARGLIKDDTVTFEVYVKADVPQGAP